MPYVNYAKFERHGFQEGKDMTAMESGAESVYGCDGYPASYVYEYAIMC